MVKKQGRNELCQCGSGKKYKRCCALKAQGIPFKNETATAPDGDEQRVECLLPIEALTSMRRALSLDWKPHIKQYYKIRRLHQEVVDSMIKYHENGKFKQRPDPNYVAPQQQERERDDTHVISCEFDMDSPEGVHAFYDMLIYKGGRNMTCITEDYINNRHYKAPDKNEFLKSMLESELGLFEVLEVDMHEGTACLRDVLTGREVTIIDVGLSGSTIFDFYLYTRIITFQGISFGSGINLVFRRSDPFVQKHIKHHKKDYKKEGEFLRFSQLYNHFSRSTGRIDVVRYEPKKW